MNLTHRVRSFFLVSSSILKKNHLSFSKKVSLLATFLIIYVKRMLDNRLLSFDNSIIGVVGFKVSVGHFEDFYWTFRDVFIEESYYFVTENRHPIIIDGGGNIGLSVLYFKWIYPAAKIIVFEPHPDNFKFLDTNLSLNNLHDIETHNIALSDRKGSISLFGTKRAATIVEGFFGRKDRWNKNVVENEVLVDTDKLSVYIKGSEIDLLKLDIEGAEGMVLRELDESEKFSNLKNIIMEFHYRASDKNKLSDIVSLLDKNNFMTAFLSQAESIPKVTLRDFTHLMVVARPKIKLN